MKKTSLQREKFGKCPMCKKDYQGADAQFVDERDEKTMFHVTCSSCGVAMLIVLSQNQFGVMSIGVPTDLVASEIGDLFMGDVISTDQVLDVHEMLKDYSGSVKDLI